MKERCVKKHALAMVLCFILVSTLFIGCGKEEKKQGAKEPIASVYNEPTNAIEPSAIPTKEPDEHGAEAIAEPTAEPVGSEHEEKTGDAGKITIDTLRKEWEQKTNPTPEPIEEPKTSSIRKFESEDEAKDFFASAVRDEKFALRFEEKYITYKHETQFATTAVNLRLGPSTSNEKVTAMSAGTKVEVLYVATEIDATGKVKSDSTWKFIKIASTGQCGWSYGSYFSTKKPVATPTPEPTDTPTPVPTKEPIKEPTKEPTKTPVENGQMSSNRTITALCGGEDVSCKVTISTPKINGSECTCNITIQVLDTTLVDSDDELSFEVDVAGKEEYELKENSITGYKKEYTLIWSGTGKEQISIWGIDSSQTVYFK